MKEYEALIARMVDLRFKKQEIDQRVEAEKERERQQGRTGTSSVNTTQESEGPTRRTGAKPEAKPDSLNL